MPIELPPILEVPGSYLASVVEIDDLADQLPGLTKVKAADDPTKLAAAIQATIDIDAAGPWQGRKYQIAWGTTPEQVLEFPRVAYDEGIAGVAWPGGFPFPAFPTPGGGVVVWDWDVAGRVAIVPAKVKQACLYQAEDVLAGKRAKRIQAIADGLASQGVGSLSESYRAGAAEPATLCTPAMRIMDRYRLRQGRIL